METKYRVVSERLAPISSSRIIFDDGALLIEGLRSDGEVAVCVRFGDALVTRIADEGTRLRLLNELGDATSAFVLEVEDSELLQWIADEGLHTRDLSLAGHYLVLSGEEITDVVSFSQPSFELRNLN